MKCMPFWKGCSRNVDYLDRSHRGLNQIPVELLRYTTCLEELLLDGNLISDLPRVRSCELMQLPVFISVNSHIEKNCSF